MRVRLALALLSVALAVPKMGTAQVFNLPEAPPQVTAEHEVWQLQGAALYYAGAIYYPTGPSVFFDQNVMVRSGDYMGVPIYVDATQSPYSVIYVPIGGNLMKPYERPRVGEVAGTVASRTPSFAVSPNPQTPPTGLPPVVVAEAPSPLVQPVTPTAVPTAASPTAASPDTVGTSGLLALPGRIESIPAPASNDGIWIEYEGVRWFSAGAAVSLVAGRYVQVGDYHGFPVYRDNRVPDVIYVASTAGGPLAPYRKR
jgi:hypothetical protein